MIEPAGKPNLLFGDNRLKLGVFGANVSGGGALTTVEERHRLSWPQNLELARVADAAGFEAFVPYARWRGFGGATNPWGSSFEPYTWAAAIAAVTEHITVFSTSHVLTVHPLMASKQLTTIDHVSGGRVALNVVAGWFEQELRMFGRDGFDHDGRYAYAREWLDIVLRLWDEEVEEFDHDGRFFTIKGAYEHPKPLQRPHPPIMNAGFSPAGNRFAAEYSTIAFIQPGQFEPDYIRGRVDSMRRLAREEFDRELQIWMPAYVVCAATDEEAERYRTHYAREHQDTQATENFIRWVIGGTAMPEEHRALFFEHLAAGVAGYPLVGSPERIASGVAALSAAGVDGLCLTWMNYEQGVPQWIDEVMPLLVDAGLRAPARSGLQFRGE